MPVTTSTINAPSGSSRNAIGTTKSPEAIHV